MAHLLFSSMQSTYAVSLHQKSSINNTIIILHYANNHPHY